jgi:hypothetical protein
MAFADQVWYCNAGNQSSTGYYAVSQFQASHAYSAGQIIRQLTAPAVGSERCFVCIAAGTSGTEPSWTVTRGAKNTSTTPVFQECTGSAAMNGDVANTPTWAVQKAAGAPTLGAIIQRNNGASFQICSTAGTIGGSEPSFSDTAGVTTSDGTSVWTSLGAVSNFTGGQAPHARLDNACANTWFGAGNTIYVGDNHAESRATAITIAPGLSQATVSKVICHNHSGSYPPTASDLRATATISSSAVSGISLNFTAGAICLYGLTFIAGTGSGSTTLAFSLNMAFCLCDTCVFKIATTATNQVINLSSSANGFMTWNNCQVSFSAVGQYIWADNAFFTWQNTAQVLATGSTVPTNLFGINGLGGVGNITLETLDLSQWTAVFAPFAANSSLGNWTIKDCKLNAAATFSTPLNVGQITQIVRADGSATAYKSARYALEGTETTETSITRVGGASDPTGQAQSRKLVTTANSQWLRPFKAEPYAIWNPITAANVTVTVCGTINAGALPNNDDIWMEVEYLGSSASPLGTIVTTTKSNLLAANAAVASDGSTWNGGGSGAGWSPFKLTTTLSSPQPGMPGYLHVRVRAAKASTTYYLDPKVVLS